MRLIRYEYSSWVANRADPTHCDKVSALLFPRKGQTLYDSWIRVDVVDYTWGYQVIVRVATFTWRWPWFYPRIFYPRYLVDNSRWLNKYVAPWLHSFLVSRRQVEQIREMSAKARRYE